MIRNRSRRLITAAMALAVASFVTGCSSPAASPSAARANTPQTLPVTAATVVRQDLPMYLTGLGSVSAYYTVSVKSRVDGQLVEVKFKEGEFVKQGELLAVIDPRPYQVQFEQAQATLFKDQASLRDAQLNYQRYKGLLENSGAMSQQQVDTQQATVEQFQGAVKTDEAQVDNAKLNLSYCHITAPVSGRIGIRLVDPGNIVHAADANPMLVITQLQPIAVLFTLPEDQLQTVAQHMRGSALQVDAYSRDDQTKLATGKLLTIDNQIDQTTGTGRLKAVFDNKGNELWPNQFVNVHLLLEIEKNATVIPSAAVQRGPQGNYVFVVKPDKTVEIRSVNVATTQGGLSQIASGLSASEIVVTDGQDKLQAGSRVLPHMQTPPATAGGENQTTAPVRAPAKLNAPYPGSGRNQQDRNGPQAGGAPKQGTASR